jgi:hypothetical protein
LRRWIEEGCLDFIFDQCLVLALVSGRGQRVLNELCWRPPGPANRASLCSGHKGGSMSFDVQVVNPLIALIAGILILLMPRLLNYVVAIYLIVIGVLGLAHHFNV